MKFLAPIFVVLAVFSANGENFPFERYRSVVERQMFGELPPGFDPAKPPNKVEKGLSAKELSKEQEQLMKAVHFSAINVAAGGEVEVGFSDLTVPNKPKHYFLRVGETAGGWKVEDADAQTATATLLKDGITLTLSLGDKSAQAVAEKASADSAANPVLSMQRPLTSRQRGIIRRREKEESDNAIKKSLEELREEMKRARQELKEAKSENAVGGPAMNAERADGSVKPDSMEGAGNEKNAAQ